jgi:large subunit ribosomal protein L10
MRIEKKYLVQEIADQLKSTSYIYLVDFSRLTVAETAELRRDLRGEEACFHVIKNAFLRRIGDDLKWPDLGKTLRGQTAVVFGGNDPSKVMKCLVNFSKKKEKLAPKGGVMDGRFLSVVDLVQLSELPDIKTLRAILLALLTSPARRVLGVMQAVPQSILNVMQAHQRKGETS